MQKEYKHLSIWNIGSKNMPNVRLAFFVLNHYNKKGRGRNTASRYLVNAYNVYKKPHNDKLTEFMKDVYLMRYIVENYHFYTKETVMSYLEHTAPKEIEKVPTVPRRTLTFDPDREDDMELFELLSGLNNRARTLVITGIILNYIRQGLDLFYLEFAGQQFVQNLVNEYHNESYDDEEAKEKKFSDVIDLMLFLGSDKTRIAEDGDMQNDIKPESNIESITKELLGG